MKEEIMKKLKKDNKDKHCGFNKITLFFSKEQVENLPKKS